MLEDKFGRVNEGPLRLKNTYFYAWEFIMQKIISKNFCHFFFQVLYDISFSIMIINCNKT